MMIHSSTKHTDQKMKIQMSIISYGNWKPKCGRIYAQQSMAQPHKGVKPGHKLQVPS